MMNIQDELRLTTNDAHKLSLELVQIVDKLNLGTDSRENIGISLDKFARQMCAFMDTVKMLGYELKRSKQ